MKKLILSISLLISVSSFSQLSPPKQKINLHLQNLNYSTNNSNLRVGPAVMLGGASFVVAGALTTPVYVAGSTTDKKPFLQQGGRAAAIISGCIVLSGGIVLSLNGY